MDSLKLTKGSSGGSKSSSTSIPLAIRFNAEEESIEELLKPSTNESSVPLLNSPQQNLEDFSWRSIQENLFSRNRSGSIEGISSVLSGSTSHNISSSDTNTIGTWKLIKGKVSQAMEDIKSSKGAQIASNKSEIGGNDDSDQETFSISDELPPSEQQQQSSILPKVKLSNFVTTAGVESDSDIDIESTDDIQFPSSSSSSLRKSLANLRSKSYIKSKVRSSKHKLDKQQQQQQQQQQQHQSVSMSQQQKQISHHKKDESPNRFSSSFPSTKAETFLKMRRKHDNKDKQRDSTIIKKDHHHHHEIESGIEVVEDMILPSITGNLDDDNDNNDVTQSNKELLLIKKDNHNNGNDNILGISIADEMITFKHRPRIDSFNSEINDNFKKIQQKSSNKISSKNVSTIKSTNLLLSKNQNYNKNNISIINKIYKIWINLSKRFSTIATIILLFSIIVLPLPSFFCGVFTCLFVILLISSITDYFKTLIINNTQNNKNGFTSIDYNFSSSSFSGKLKIPDNVQVCEIPAAEEHLSLKSYSGWMNEINNYDPTNHHLSMTTPVFVRLSGSNLTLSNTNYRIPKRAMWNESIIDKDNVIFTQTRYFNLLGCRVEMCPKGLARKRHFSRKYPIQLIIKNSSKTDSIDKSNFKTPSKAQQHQQQQEESSEQSLNESKNSKYDEQQQKQKQETSNKNKDDEGNNVSTNTNSDLKKRNLNESNEDLLDKNSNTEERHNSIGIGFDFGNAIANSDLQKLQNNYEVVSKEGVPCGDETRVLLFARCDREKEDWYRRFQAASKGQTFDQQEHIPDIVMFTEDEIAIAIKATQSNLNESGENSPTTDEKTKKLKSTENTTIEQSSSEKIQSRKTSNEDNSYEGVLISSCALRNLSDYIRFMAKYQKACFQSSCPASTTIKVSSTDNNAKRNRRQKSKEDDLWKGIDQALFKQQSGNVVWFNILIGRILYNCLNNKELLDRIQEFLQRKLSAIRLPSFMEDVIIDELDLGDTPPLIHRVSQPLLDERGTWIDADISYEGLMHMTITTKLNLLRLKRQQHHEFNDTPATAPSSSSTTTLNSSIDVINSSSNQNNYNNGNYSNNSPTKNNNSFNKTNSTNASSSIINCAIYDSNAESTGASSSESESQPVGGNIDLSNESHSSFHTTPGSSRRFLRIVDRITASNLFQSATEISYIQRAMENMSTKITLKVELKGLVSRIVVNLPPPPSDRVWLAFRGPPRLWISAKPTVGDHAFDWSIVTTIIENKLCDEVYKYLVYPNMVDIIVPILGEPTYKEGN